MYFGGVLPPLPPPLTLPVGAPGSFAQLNVPPYIVSLMGHAKSSFTVDECRWMDATGMDYLTRGTNNY